MQHTTFRVFDRVLVQITVEEALQVTERTLSSCQCPTSFLWYPSCTLTIISSLSLAFPYQSIMLFKTRRVVLKLVEPAIPGFSVDASAATVHRAVAAAAGGGHAAERGEKAPKKITGGAAASEPPTKKQKKQNKSK